MKAANCNQMKAIDQIAIKEMGIPGIVLMENAAFKVVEEIKNILGDIRHKRVWVFCGKGNNGGDGFAIARHLFNMGVNVIVVLTTEPKDIKGDALINYEIICKMKIPIIQVDDISVLKKIANSVCLSDMLIDAIFGTGVKGIVEGVVADVIRFINSLGKYVVSVDIPSGINGDNGQICGICVKANRTVTFALPKVGLLQYPAVDYIGKLIVVDISIPSSIIDAQNIHINTIEQEYIRKLLPVRKQQSNKGDYGKILIIAGSIGMTGAASLVSMGALRSGAGLVTAGIPRSLNSIIEMKITEAMSMPLEDEGRGILVPLCSREIVEKMKKMDALVFGPGLSNDVAILHILRDILKQSNIPVIIDADGINALSRNINVLKERRCPIVLTPHPGEMARLTGLSIWDIQSNRIEVAREFAEKWDVVLVLKGARTVIACPDGEVYVNDTGNPGMATGGSGDVLCGIIAALIGQGVDVRHAVIAGVYIHGFAADLWAENKGQHGLIATDIVDTLPVAFREISLC